MRVLLAGIGCLAVAGPAVAENWRVTGSASATETYTSNADFSPGSSSQGDFVTSVSGGLQIRGTGARVRLNGSIAATQILYASEGQNNTFSPNVNLAGWVEAIEKFAFVEASASITPTFLSPFGPQPSDLVNATNNRYTQQTYRVSPYIQGVVGQNISYSVRDDNIWTESSGLGNSSIAPPGTYANNFTARVSTNPTPWGLSVDASRNYYTNGISNGSFDVETVRAILAYQFDPQVQGSLRGGYEYDRFPLTHSEGAIYGAGAQWNPTERTQVGGWWEHRFFGSSYLAQASHRLPNAAIRANFSRGLNSYPQLALAIPAGVTVAQFVDAAFTTRIPDPAERAIAVEQFLAASGLPPTLASPVNFYAASILLQQSATISLVLIGVRHSLSFSVFNTKSEAIAGTGQVLPPALQFGNNNTQTGAGITFSQQLTGFTSLGAHATYSRTSSNVSEGPSANLRSNNGSVGVNLSTSFGPKTSGALGLNYTIFEPSGGANTASSSSLNIYASVTHTF